MLELIHELQRKVESCSHCKGGGYLLDGRNKLTTCSCLKSALYELRLVKSGIPPRFKALEFKDYMYKNSSTYAQIRKYLDQSEKALATGTGLFLFGRESTGKSMLACCMLKDLMYQGHECGFTRFSSIFSNPEERDKLLGKEKSFAVIDDITEVLDNLVNFKETTLTEEQSHGAVSFLMSLLSARAIRNQPTIITSSVSIEKISKRFSHLSSFLLGSFLQVECVEGDFRGTRAQERLLTEFGFDQID